MKVGESFKFQEKNIKGTITETIYLLNKVEDNVAFFDFTETRVYSRSGQKTPYELSAETNTVGKLEYDLTDSYYRLIERNEIVSFKYHIDSLKTDKMKNVDNNFMVTSKSITTI